VADYGMISTLTFRYTICPIDRAVPLPCRLNNVLMNNEIRYGAVHSKAFLLSALNFRRKRIQIIKKM